MTKEQIYEKITVITTGPNCIADMKVDAEKLASYLATIEERLEKVEGGRPVKNPYYFGLADKARLEADKAFNPDGSPKDITPTECEHKHRGLYGECLKCTEKLDDSPTEVKVEQYQCKSIYENGLILNCTCGKCNLTEVKDWEKEFDERFVVKSNAGTNLLRYTDADVIKHFIRNLLNK
jgi:hypothetical protein